MSRFSPLGPAALVGVGLAAISLTLSACSPVAPEDNAVQSSPQSSPVDTAQSTIDGVAQSTIDELIELYPEMVEMPRERLVTAFSEYAAKVGMTTEDYLQNVIRETRENDEAMRRAVEGATGDAPAQSH